MPTIQEEIKKQRILTLVFLITIFVTAVILYSGYFKKTPTLSPTEEYSVGEKEVIFEKKIDIDYQTLESPLLEKLEPFPQIEPLPSEKSGRENPFLPY